MAYVIKVNTAVAQMNIDPSTFRHEYRQFIQEAGYNVGASPQETAILLVGQLPLIFKAQADYRIIREWISKRKIDVENREVRNSLYDLGLYEYLDAHYPER